MNPIPRLTLTPPLVPVYLGCHGDKGHYFFSPGMRKMASYSIERPYYPMDGYFAPQSTMAQGAAWMHCQSCGDLTFQIISWHDYSIDSRPGSNCTFLIPTAQPLDFEALLAECRKLFPEVFARIRYPITLHPS